MPTQNFWPLSMAVISLYPPYSPDLAPSDFLLYQKMKSQLLECCFLGVPKIQNSCWPHHTRFQKRQLLGVILAEAEMLDPLHKLRRGWQWPVIKVSIYYYWLSPRTLGYSKIVPSGMNTVCTLNQICFLIKLMKLTEQFHLNNNSTYIYIFSSITKEKQLTSTLSFIIWHTEILTTAFTLHS